MLSTNHSSLALSQVLRSRCYKTSDTQTDNWTLLDTDYNTQTAEHRHPSTRISYTCLHNNWRITGSLPPCVGLKEWLPVAGPCSACNHCDIQDNFQDNIPRIISPYQGVTITDRNDWCAGLGSLFSGLYISLNYLHTSRGVHRSCS